MSSLIQTKIEEIRNQSVQYGNTRQKVVELLSLINSEKLEKLEVQEIFAEMMDSIPGFIDYVNTGQANLVLGFQGEATEANAPTAYNPTTYPDGLFETYIVVEPITTGSAWGIEVTQTNLDENFVYFNVKNGVVSVFMTDKINGKSAYQSYLDTTTDSPPMTEAEWASLDISDGSITPEKTNFANTSYIFSNAQRFDKTTVTPNSFVNAGNGTLAGNSGYVASDFIYVGDCANITMTTLIHIAFYAENNEGSYISGREYGGDTIEVPTTANYCRVSVLNDWSVDSFQLEKGIYKTTYQNYVTPTEGVIFPKLVERQVATYTSLFAQLTNPSTIYWLAGKELSVYFDNTVIAGLGKKTDSLYNSVLSSYGKFLEKKYRVVAPNLDFDFTLRTENGTNLISKTTNVKVAPTTNGNGITRKILTIGDSTVNAAYTIFKINQYFSTDVMNTNFIGTREGNGVKHEGRSGWAFSNYNTDFPDNPFWNSGTSSFDFSYYLTSTSQTMGANDWVFIQLGINDFFPSSILDDSFDVDARLTSVQGYLDDMIASIHAHNAGIRIGISVTIPPAISQDATGYGLNSSIYSLEYYIKKGLAKWWKYLLDTYDNTIMATNKVYLVANNICIDRENNFPTTTMQIDSINTTMETVQNNDVHPETTGYEQMSLPYIGIIKYFA